jgi:hypothetical protein
MSKLAAKVLKLSLLSLVLMTLVLTSYTTANASHHHEEHPCTQLWVYTEPVQKGPCIVFKHSSGHELEKANRANIEFNKGVEAGNAMSLAFNSTNQLNCPSDNTKEFCSGWESATQFTLEQYKAVLTTRGVLNNPSGNPSNSTDGGKCIGDTCPNPEQVQYRGEIGDDI